MVHTTYSVTLLVLLLAKSVEQGGAVTVPVGGVAVLSCDMVYDLTKELVWLDEDRGVLRRLPNGDLHDFRPFKGRVSLVDIVNLRIENVRLEDEGEYKCQQDGAVTNGTPQDLEIAMPPDPAAPTITDYSGENLMSGSGLTLTCVSTGGKPPSDVTWWTGDTQVQASSSHTTDSTGQGDTRSELTIPELQPSHNGAVYQCRASQLALTQVETDQVTLSVACVWFGFSCFVLVIELCSLFSCITIMCAMIISITECFYFQTTVYFPAFLVLEKTIAGYQKPPCFCCYSTPSCHALASTATFAALDVEMKPLQPTLNRWTPEYPSDL